MTHIQLLNILSILFPGSLYPRDYTFAEDSAGNASIALWNTTLGIQPTTGQLLAELAKMQLQQAQTVQIAAIATASSTAQTTGFTSSALGSAYTYPSGLQDQSNLCACCTYSLFPGNASDWTVEFWCSTSAGVGAFVAHTAAQIQQVGRDAQASIMTQKAKQNTLTQQIIAATSIDAVQAVVWS
jgi:hypothetical protein